MVSSLEGCTVNGEDWFPSFRRRACVYFLRYVSVDNKLYTAVMDAMAVHPNDASVLEASCGCLLASALDNEEAKAALDKAGVRAKVRQIMQERSGAGKNMRFGGAFTTLKDWLRGKEENKEATKQRPPGKPPPVPKQK